MRSSASAPSSDRPTTSRSLAASSILPSLRTIVTFVSRATRRASASRLDSAAATAASMKGRPNSGCPSCKFNRYAPRDLRIRDRLPRSPAASAAAAPSSPIRTLIADPRDVVLARHPPKRADEDCRPHDLDIQIDWHRTMRAEEIERACKVLPRLILAEDLTVRDAERLLRLGALT